MAVVALSYRDVEDLLAQRGIDASYEALDKLQALRDRLKKPLIVRSAYRSSEHNRAVGGAPRSKHLDGKLAPNDPEVLANVSTILLSVGDYKASVETMQLAWVLDPYLSPVFTGAVLSQGLFALGDYKSSKEVANDCLAKTPEDVRCLESLVRALGELGPPEETTRAVNKLLRLSPKFTVSEYIRRASKNRRDDAAISRWADGLRKAGIPE